MEVYRILFIVTVGDYLVPWPTRREPSAIYRPQAEFSGTGLRYSHPQPTFFGDLARLNRCVCQSESGWAQKTRLPHPLKLSS
jgi:hypothetical protein